jgi:ACS family D-galactonate transporter-like MFS transporter
MARSSADVHLSATGEPYAPPVSSVASATRASTVRWRIFAIIFVLTMVNLIDRVSLSIAMPTIAKEFHVVACDAGSDSQQFLLGVCAVADPRRLDD